MCPTDEKRSERRAFNKAVKEPSIDDPIEPGKFHPLCRTLKLWAEINGFESTAANVKWCVSYWNAEQYRDDEGRHRDSLAKHTTLLRCFGQVFKGSDVGALGADIVGGALRRSFPLREAAILVLEGWCEDDEDGVWLNMMGEQMAREKDPVLKDYCIQVLDNYDWGTGELGEETEQLNLPLSSANLKRQKEISDYIKTPEGRAKLRGLPCPGLISKEEHQPFLDVAEKYGENVISGHITTERVPKFLQDNLGIHPHLALDLLESHKIGKVSTRATSINILVGRMYPAASQSVLFAWTPTWAFSMTTHEKSDWLIGIFS